MPHCSLDFLVLFVFQLLSHVRIFVTPWTAAHQPPLSFTISWSLPKLMAIVEKEMATHSSVLAWRISGWEEPGGLPSMGSHRVEHDWSDLAAWPLSRWCYLTTSSSDTLFSFRFHSFPASESFPMIWSWISISGDRSIGISAVFWMNIQGWFPLELTGFISLLSQGLLRVFSSTSIQRH